MPFKKNVYLLGAGASADAGAPLMWNFLDCARSLLDDPRSSLTADDRERFRTVFKYLFDLRKAQAFVELDLDNIEDLFGVVDLDSRVGRAGAQKAREDLVYLIVKTLDATIRPRSEAYNLRTGFIDHDATPYECFAQIVARVPLTDGDQRGKLRPEPDGIITFNYDLLIDAALTKIGFTPDYCLDQAFDRRGPSHSRRARLLKLHGSAGWTYCPRCDDGRVYTFADFASAQYQPCEDQHHSPMAPLIVPPTWDKGASKNYMAPVWKAAWEELQSAQRLFIVGYSAPPSDRHFRYLIASAVAANANLERIIVVTARDGEERAKQTYKALFTGSAAEHRLQFEATGFSWIAGGSRRLFDLVGGS